MKDTSLFDKIIQIVCEGEEIPFESLVGKNRKMEVVYARQLVMYFAKTMSVGSLAFIGSKFYKDHATVLHSVKTIRNYIETDRQKREEIKEYSKKFDKVKKIIAIKDQIIKLITPIIDETSKLEQRLIFIQLTVDNLMKKIKTL